MTQYQYRLRKKAMLLSITWLLFNFDMQILMASIESLLLTLQVRYQTELLSTTRFYFFDQVINYWAIGKRR